MAANPNSKRRKRLHVQNHTFTNAMASGVTGRVAWLRCLLDAYVAEPDILEPKLSADGEPVRNRFGSFVETAPRAITYLRDSVWMSKAFLVAGWREVFNEGYHIEQHPQHYEEAFNPLANDARTRRVNEAPAGVRSADRWTRVGTLSYAHPMDQHLTKMVKLGQMLKGGKDRYFPSREECAAVDRPEAYEVFARRKAFYDTNPTKAIHQNQPGWERVLEKMSRYVACDFTRIIRLAEKETNAVGEPLFKEDADKENVVRIHVSRWLAAGKIAKVTNHMYRVTGAVYKDRVYDWRKISPLNWMDKLILYAYGKRVENPEWTFKLKETYLAFGEGFVTEGSFRVLLFAAAKGEERFFERYGDAGCYRLSGRLFSALNHRAKEIPPLSEEETKVIVSKRLARLRAKGIGVPRTEA